jgi:cell division protein FtsW (lipid II flippase)
MMNSEQKSRITTLFQQQDGGLPPRGDGYHLYQSKFILAQGGLWGTSNWSLAETQHAELQTSSAEDLKNYHLPAARTDFICCLVGEHYGFMGVLLIQVLYLLLFYSAVLVASQTREPFGRLVITGVVTLLGAQVVINTGMTVGLMPITGLTLPLLSYGGSSLLSTALAIGLIINIALRPGYELTGEPFRFRS